MFRVIYDKHFGGTVAGMRMTSRTANFRADVERPLQKLMKREGLVGRCRLAWVARSLRKQFLDQRKRRADPLVAQVMVFTE